MHCFRKTSKCYAYNLSFALAIGLHAKRFKRIDFFYLSTKKCNGKGRQKSIGSVKTLQSNVWRKVNSSVEETSRRLCIGRWGEVGVREVTGLGSTHG